MSRDEGDSGLLGGVSGVAVDVSPVPVAQGFYRV